MNNKYTYLVPFRTRFLAEPNGALMLEPVSQAKSDVIVENRHISSSFRYRKFNCYAVPGQKLSRASYLKKNNNWGGAVEKAKIDGFNFACVFRLKDDSMRPAYEEGDHLVGDKINSLAELEGDQLCVIQIHKSYVLKRVHHVDGHWLLSCNSEDYPIYKIEEHQVTGVWVVQARLTLGLLQRKSVEQDRSYLKMDLKNISSNIEQLRDRLEEGCDNN